MATKKTTKKVATPIDNRETFVSLQKNFADSDIPVEEKLRTLHELQKADSEIDKIVQLRGELPAEVEAIENEIAGLKAKAAVINAEIDGMNEKIAMNRQQGLEYDDLIAKYQKQLEGISNSREYDSISKEIENTSLLKDIAEKDIFDTRHEISNRKAALDDIKDHIDIRNEDLKAKKEELNSIVESTAAEEKKLVATREQCATRIDERTMSAYERIRASVHNHLAVVTVFGGNSCGGCFNTITPQRLLDIAGGKRLIICEHCGRIILPSEDQD